MLMRQTGIEWVCIKETCSAPSDPTPLSSLGSKQEAAHLKSVPSFTPPPLPTSSLWQACKLCPLTERTAFVGLLIPPPLLPAYSACSLLSPFSISSFSKELSSPHMHFRDLRQQVPHPPINVLRQGNHPALWTPPMLSISAPCPVYSPGSSTSDLPFIPLTSPTRAVWSPL